jgi:4-hydroxy-tetrahydrodipicolinate reductase
VKIIVNGAAGRMGQITCETLDATDDLDCVARLGRDDDLAAQIKSLKADAVIDLTTASAAFDNTRTILEAGARPIIGTSGLQDNDIEKLATLAKQHNLGGIIAPNFSLGAVLMMQFAQKASAHFEQAEIIEMHHEKKADAPSGTALRTAELMADARTQDVPVDNCRELIPGARGARKADIPVHSVRLPGFLAHQQVIFGSLGETLTLRHDSIDAKCFMPGVLLACRKVMNLNELVCGLEHLM